MHNHFYWTPDIVNFTTLGSGFYFIFIPLNFELHCRTQVSYLETILSFWGLLSNIIDGTRVVFSPGLILPYYWGNMPLSICSNVPCRFLRSDCWKCEWPQVCVSPKNSHPPYVPFRWFFPQPWIISSHACADQISAEDWRGSLCRSLKFFLCAALYSPCSSSFCGILLYEI